MPEITLNAMAQAAWNQGRTNAYIKSAVNYHLTVNQNESKPSDGQFRPRTKESIVTIFHVIHLSDSATCFVPRHDGKPGLSGYRFDKRRKPVWRDIPFRSGRRVAEFGMIAALVALAGFVAFLPDTIVPAVEWQVITESGDLHIIGQGDTCKEAWQDHGPIPADWSEVTCR